MPDQPLTPSHPSDQDLPLALRRGTSRRVMFQRAGLVALAGTGAAAFAACGDSSPGTTTSPSATTAASESPSASAGAPSSASPSASSPSSSAAVPTGTKVAKADVPVGGGKVLPEKYVVTQPTAGEFKAFTNICTHQGCPVASVQNGEIICDCHGSHFSITDGSPVSGPAAQRNTGSLAAKTVAASGSNVYVSG